MEMSGLRYEFNMIKKLRFWLYADAIGNPSVVPNSEFDLKEFQFKNQVSV